jgi:hypothetical protein
MPNTLVETVAHWNCWTWLCLTDETDHRKTPLANPSHVTDTTANCAERPLIGYSRCGQAGRGRRLTLTARRPRPDPGTRSPPTCWAESAAVEAAPTRMAWVTGIEDPTVSRGGQLHAAGRSASPAGVRAEMASSSPTTRHHTLRPWCPSRWSSVPTRTESSGSSSRLPPRATACGSAGSTCKCGAPRQHESPSGQLHCSVYASSGQQWVRALRTWVTRSAH